MGKGGHSESLPLNESGRRNGDVAKEKKDAKLQSPLSSDGQRHQSKSRSQYVTPPDGGWGWVIVFSSFMIHVIADGIVYSFGVFLMEFVDYFKAGRGATSWVGSLQPAVTFTVGPLSSALTNRFGCRPVTVAGAILAAVGFILSMFAPNLYYLYFTSGIMAGLGFGLIYLPAIVSVAQYFEKRRSFATGLAVCGSGFGTFLLAPITEALVNTYQWQGAMLLLGGIILNIVACGLVFRPLKAPSRYSSSPSASPSFEESDCASGLPAEQESLLSETQQRAKGGRAEGSSGVQKPTCVGDVEIVIDNVFPVTDRLMGQGERGGFVTVQSQTVTISEEPHDTLSNGNAVPASPTSRSEGWTPLLDESESQESDQATNPPGQLTNPQVLPSLSVSQPTSHAIRGEGSLDQMTSPFTTTWDGPSSPPSHIVRMSSLQESQQRNMTPEEELRQLSVSQCLVSEYKPNPLASLAMSEGALNHYHRDKNERSQSGGARHRNRGRNGHSTSESHGNTLAPLTRKDIFYSGSLYNIPMYRSQPDVYKAAMTPHDTSTSHDQVDQSEDSSNACFNLSREMKQTLHDMLSFGLLKNPVFLMFAISNFFTSIGFNMPFIFLPDRAELAGIDRDRAAWLLSVIGIANTLGRVIFGFLSDRPWVNRLMLYNTALTICGLATAVSPVVGSNYALLVTYAAVFGLFIGVYVSLTSVVLVDLLGLEYLTNSFGLLLLFQGAATFVGPPIAGWLCDWTGSYDISFIVMGSLMALGGAMLYFLPIVQRYYSRHVPNLLHDIDLGKVDVSSSVAADPKGGGNSNTLSSLS